MLPLCSILLWVDVGGTSEDADVALDTASDTYPTCVLTKNTTFKSNYKNSSY